MGRLFLTNTSDASHPADQDIVYISCDQSDYQGNMRSQDILSSVWNSANLTAAILFSRTSDYCAYRDPTAQMQEFPIFSMKSKENSTRISNDIRRLPPSNRYMINIKRSDPKDDDDNNDSNDSNPTNPLGPSPSTAVAMIILYSITGIITALFLVIIITGAVRAHRHPDRYGPRDVLGRPRQSRARGLGRAILDTIPIVKFGERDPPKPTDVELGSTSEARDVAAPDTEAAPGAPSNGFHSGVPANPLQEIRTDQSGIAPAQPVVAAATDAQGASSAAGLGCSICTDDFEKGQDIRVLPCGHKFHPECVDPWLLNVSGTCPLCRVDLRPTTSRSTNGDNPDALAPPLHPDTEVSHRRRSALRDILTLRHRPNASAEERISALRRLREQRNRQHDEAMSSGNPGASPSSEDVTDVRRSRRISARLHDVFSVRTRRREDEDGAPPTEGSNDDPTSGPSEPANMSNGTNERDPQPRV
ncbi:hypothetical protein GQ43DRAFT_378447 [Delitschia confertaspora ATCC 74209]|uniref:RING-type domain-containing protein n=1 Tax=Delitschia confertaspora ATCC 74209 TaxID=1513339 RepID=A0A9P4JFM6_9PLEO|nr:hypothetical protein GQ43DRAFT_378447 [Delitschia confertaspora ATCC 74209]